MGKFSEKKSGNSGKSLEYLTFRRSGEIAGRAILARDDRTILTVALEGDIELNHSCGGAGSCGTCLVRIISPEPLSQRESLEQEMADDRGFEPQERLSCQTKAKAGLIVELPDYLTKKEFV